MYWEPPPVSSINGEFLGYILSYRPQSSAEFIKIDVRDESFKTQVNSIIFLIIFFKTIFTSMLITFKTQLCRNGQQENKLLNRKLGSIPAPDFILILYACWCSNKRPTQYADTLKWYKPLDRNNTENIHRTIHWTVCSVTPITSSPSPPRTLRDSGQRLPFSSGPKMGVKRDFDIFSSYVFSRKWAPLV